MRRRMLSLIPHRFPLVLFALILAGLSLVGAACGGDDDADSDASDGGGSSDNAGGADEKFYVRAVCRTINNFQEELEEELFLAEPTSQVSISCAHRSREHRK